MRIPPEKLEEFKVIYKKEFGKDLTDAEALEKGIQVLRMMELIYKPMTVADYEATQKRLAELRAKDSES